MSNHHFYITHWCGIPPAYLRRPDGTLDEARFVQMKEAGLNLIAPYDHGVGTNREILALCHKLGLRVTLSDHRLHAARCDGQNRRALLQSVIDDYADCPALHGYHLFDEPHRRDFCALADTLALLKQLDPSHEGYVNLFANYVPTALLGFDDYATYVRRFVTDVNPPILSYDHYHFLTDEPMPAYDIPSERERMIFESAYRKENRPGFFDNIEEIRSAARQAGLPFMVIVLLTAHGPCRDITEAELRFEVYQSLAYGASRLSYFTYWTPGEPNDPNDIWHWNAGMIDQLGHPTHHYGMVARVNRELQAIGDLLLGKKSLAVYHVGACPDTKTSPWPGAFGDITAIEAVDLTVGCFEDGYAVLANKNHEKPIVASLTVKDGTRVEQFQKTSGEWTPLASTDGCCLVALDAGDGELIRTK